MTSEITAEHLKKFNGKKVLVVGDLGLDRYTHGISTRLCPEAPVPVFNPSREELKPGLAGNVAANVAALGGIARLCSIIGDDSEGFSLLDALDQAGVKEVEIFVGKTRDRTTTVKHRYYIDRHMLLRVDEEKTHPFQEHMMKSFTAGVTKQIKDWADIVIVQDYAKGLIDRDLMSAIIHCSIYCGKYVVVDPSPHHDAWMYRGSTFLKPNKAEFEKLTAQIEHMTPEKFRKALDLTGLIVTQGANGMKVYEDKKEYNYPALKKEVFDVCGAGDTVTAALALGLASGLDLVDSVQIANAAASVVVGKFGTATVNLEELKSILQEA